MKVRSAGCAGSHVSRLSISSWCSAPDVNLAVESTMRFTSPPGETSSVDDYRQTTGVLLSLVSHDVLGACRTPSGAAYPADGVG